MLEYFQWFQKAIKFFKTDNPEDFVFTSFLLNMEDAFPACFFIKTRIEIAIFSNFSNQNQISVNKSRDLKFSIRESERFTSSNHFFYA